VTKRKQRKALARQEAQVREWAMENGRRLVLAICGGEAVPATPYGVGVVLDPGEQVWVECPVRFLQERPPTPVYPPGCPPFRPWLVTSDRIVGRLGDGRLYGYRWDQMVGCRVDVSRGREHVSVDLSDGSPLAWMGPGVVPMAVAAVYRLHGRDALVNHPGLALLRAGDEQVATVGATVAELNAGSMSMGGWWDL